MKGGTARGSVIVNVASPTTFSISGRVLNANGQPLSGIRVSTSGSRYAFSESDGSYTITRLAAGNYTVTAIDPVADAYTFSHPFFNNPVTVGPDFATADLIVSTNPPAIITPIIAANSVWRYLDDGSNVRGRNGSTQASSIYCGSAAPACSATPTAMIRSTPRSASAVIRRTNTSPPISGAPSQSRTP